MTDKAQAAARRKIRMAMRQAKARLPASLPGFFALTDPIRLHDPLALISGLPHGAGMVYRHFGALDRGEVASRLARVAAARGIFLLVGNDPELAGRIGAAGVHWSEARTHEARRWRSRFAIMTCAAHSRQAVFAAREVGCNAALLSTVFPSDSPSASTAMGALRFRNLARTSPLPVYALGGVTAKTIGRLNGYGAAAISGALVFSELL